MAGIAKAEKEARLGKTELCSFYYNQEKTNCQRWDKCTYAHSVRELYAVFENNNGRVTGCNHWWIATGEIPPPEGCQWVREAGIREGFFKGMPLWVKGGDDGEGSGWWQEPEWGWRHKWQEWKGWQAS